MPRTRSLRSTLTVLAAAALIATAANTVSYAAGGPSVLLGKSNTASKTTTITAKNGPAVSLRSKPSVPSLAVSSKRLVPRLNADMLDGAHLAQISPTTYRQTLNLPVGSASVPDGTMAYRATTRLPAGTYRVRMTGIMEPGAGANYTCLAVDYTKLVVSDLTAYFTVASVSDTSDRIDLTQDNLVRIVGGHKIVFGCAFNGGATTVAVPPTFTFQKATATRPVPGAAVFNPPPRAGHRLSGGLD
ncbi:hypothetical protein [Nocardioides sp.]|uniref:hypothetical protein n=1 Tax=Nocardioides sp. TaxID=35761 RepID=UPI0037850F59